MKETTIGRILFNQVVPKEVGYINEILTKRSLRDIIAVVMKKAGADKVAAFLDDIKAHGLPDGLPAAVCRSTSTP